MEVQLPSVEDQINALGFGVYQWVIFFAASPLVAGLIPTTLVSSFHIGIILL